MICHVSFRPARKVGRLYHIDGDGTKESGTRIVTVETIPKLIAEVRRLAADFGHVCATNVRMASGPEPDGFRQAIAEVAFLDFRPSRDTA